MTKNKTLGIITCIFALASAFGVSFVANDGIKNMKAHADEEEYKIVLSASNGAITEDMPADEDGTWSNDSILEIEYREKTIQFGTHYLAPGREGEWATMKNDWEEDFDEGMLYNITPLYGIKSITIVHENIDYCPGWNISWGFDEYATYDLSTFPKAACVEEYDLYPEDEFVTTFDFYNELPNYFLLDAYGGIECVESITIEYSCTTKTVAPDYYSGFNNYCKYTLESDGKGYELTSYDGEDYSEIVIPSSFRGLPVISTGYWSFRGHSEITKLVLPEGLVEVKNSSFEGTSISELVIPSTIECLGAAAFQSCTNLRKVYFYTPLLRDYGVHIFSSVGDIKIFYAFDNFAPDGNIIDFPTYNTVINIGQSSSSNVTYAYNQTLEDFENGELSGTVYYISEGLQWAKNS